LNPINLAYFRFSAEVSRAMRANLPIVALESTVITHGLPYPENHALAVDMQKEVRQKGATPATVAVLSGKIHIGLQDGEIEQLSRANDMHKLSSRDFAPAVALKWSGGTTVAATMVASHAAGIRVFATGGIGGVHRELHGSEVRTSADVSADLPQLANTPQIVVCAGAKAILDLPATLETLETMSVPVIGWMTDDFPAFYSTTSGLSVSARADSPRAVADIARAHWELGFRSAVLVVVPPPAEMAMPYEAVDQAVRQALKDARSEGVRGQAVTPFLLKRMTELTGGASLQANLALLRNNARVAAQIARELAEEERLKIA
jgi:pseudouridine-5'-phosphate glycosidase